MGGVSGLPSPPHPDRCRALSSLLPHSPATLLLTAATAIFSKGKQIMFSPYADSQWLLTVSTEPCMGLPGLPFPPASLFLPWGIAAAAVALLSLRQAKPASALGPGAYCSYWVAHCSPVFPWPVPFCHC